MMSSEEESDSHGSSADGLLKKQKRARQRVDAGEPRNSYSSIPNFTSRPAAAGAGFMSGGIYGAVFNQARHFGASGPGPGALYPPARMLNELLGRAPKQESDDDGGVAGAGGELAHHVLRDILQGRKKELRQLERELRLAAGAASPASPASPASSDNNNVLANNNNDEPKDKCALALRRGRVDSRADDDAAREALSDDLLDDAALCLNGAADSRSLPSPPSVEALVAPKLEPEEPDKERLSPTPSRCDKPLEVKRARVENIVSTMRSSPVPPATQPQVNGCKKRKLYHPQQHDGGAAAAERYLHGAQAQREDSEEDTEKRPFQQKIVEKNALKSQLRSMQEQLAEMQEKYVQLCNRMEHESKTMDDDDALSSEAELLDDAPEKPSPPASPEKAESPVAASRTPPDAGVLSHVVGKMMASRHPNPHSLPPGFNGALPLVPHLPHDHQTLHSQHPHHNINSAAAMYLNVSQKLFIEQEQARIAKEHAESLAAAAHHQQQHHAEHRAPPPPPRPRSRQRSPTPRPHTGSKPPSISSELAERLDALRNNANSATPVSVSGAELEGLAEVLKNEIAASLTSLVDSIVTRFVHQRRYLGKQSEAAAAAADRLNKDLLLASRLLERKSPGAGACGAGADKPVQGPMPGNAPLHRIPNSNAGLPNGVAFVDHSAMMSVSMNMNGPRQSAAASFPLHELGGHANQNPHARPPAVMFQAPKPPPGINHALFNGQPFCVERENPEQNEALSLVVTPKKKRHKVTDTRITPRTVSRILGEGLGPSPAPDKFPESPPPRPYCGPGGLALPTSVAIANPSLHESQVFSPYSPFFGAGGMAGMAGMGMRGAVAAHSPPTPHERDSPPLPHAPALLHPALLAAAHRASSTPDYLRPHHLHAGAGACMEQQDLHSDCNSTDITYDGIQPTSSTLTPMHLRKAKLMFFWVRYPSSAVLKMYFPDIKFNKNNTAQLVKWFSNFREFYYIQMEKYARQAISEGAKSADELHVAGDSEIYRVLNLHYNRNNHIEVPSNFRYVVEQTLREFYRAIQGGKDSEQSWKKSIYKIISRLDDPVPEYFKSPNFLEQLE